MNTFVVVAVVLVLWVTDSIGLLQPANVAAAVRVRRGVKFGLGPLKNRYCHSFFF